MKQSNTKFPLIFTISLFVSVLCACATLSAEPTLPSHTNPTNEKITDELGASLYSRSISYGEIEFNLETRSATKRFNTSTPRRIAKIFSSGFSIKNWKQQYLPLLNDLPIKINGKALTISINDTENQFFIASDKEQMLVSSSGKILWKHSVHETTSEAIITEDEQYIIIRYKNDIIRWLDYKTGYTLFSLFVQPDTLQWVIWTPEGYYDSSYPELDSLDINASITRQNSFTQLRHYLFRPDIVSQVMANDSPQSIVRPLIPSDITAPVISSLDTLSEPDGGRIAYCINAMPEAPVSVFFSINNTTVQSKTKLTLSENSHCQYMAYFNKPTLSNDYLLTARAYDLKNNIWSLRSDQTITSKNRIEQDNSRLLFVTDKINSSRNPLLIPLTKNAQSILNVERYFHNPKHKAPFILYLSSYCTITENDIYFASSSTNQKTLSLSKLSEGLQSMNNANSLVFIDCHVTDDDINRHITKKLIHNFMFETGRSSLVQFSNAKELKTGSKDSYMITTLGLAISGSADKNDDLSIDSNELMNFMITTLPEATFEGSGDAGIIYSQIRRDNVFKLPVNLKE